MGENNQDTLNTQCHRDPQSISEPISHEWETEASGTSLASDQCAVNYSRMLEVQGPHRHGKEGDSTISKKLMRTTKV